MKEYAGLGSWCSFTSSPEHPNRRGMTNPAIQSYRTALRATRVAFNGDAFMIRASTQKIREGFELNRQLTNKVEIEEAVTHMNEVAKYLVKTVVQAEKQPNDNYLLKIHDKTELGLNETIKKSNRENMGSLAGAKVHKCC